MKTIQTVTALFMGLFLCVSNTYADDAAAKLNQDWKNTNRTGCKSGDPDYYCSGIIVHVFDDDSFTSNSNPWMPNDMGIKHGHVSFSYLRQDITVPVPLYPGDIPAGYIFSPNARLTPSRQFTMYCEYPINGASDDRLQNGCGNRSFNNNFTDLGTCKTPEFNVDTSDKYAKNVTQEPKTMCSASPDQAGFTMMLDTIKKLKAEGEHPFYVNWNELVIQEWSNKTGKDEDVPIEAFFYSDITGKEKADAAAKSYHDLTGIDVPVVAVDVKKLVSGDDAPFSNESQ